MRHLRINGQPVNLPGAGVPAAVQEAFDKALRISDARSESSRERDAADTALRKARDNETKRRAKAYADTGAFGDDESPIDAAEAALEQAQRDLAALDVAKEIAGRELNQAIADNAETWAKAARADAKKALVKLVTALRMGEEAAAALRDSIGALNMLHEREQGSGTLSVKFYPRSHFFSVDAGLEGIRQAVAEATAELEARKKTTGVYVPDEPEDDDVESGATYTHYPELAERAKPRREPIWD